MPRGKSVTTTIFINKYKPKMDGKCPISIRVTYNREKRFYDTGYRLLPGEYEKLYSSKPRAEHKAILAALIVREESAKKVIESIGDGFTFLEFERQYLSNRSISDSLESAFDDYIATIEPERVGTINNYECARNSFKRFKAKARVGDVSVQFLKEYESSMKKDERSVTTIGIYCRNLRSVLNWLIGSGEINKSVYPFGSAKDGKYEILTSKNKKKALSLPQIASIYNYVCVEGSNEEMCRDYWMFSYMGNGLNIKDFCLLKWKNINGNRISFIREKSKRTKKEVEAIQIIIQPEMQAIIDRWAAKNKDKNNYIFPCLTDGMDAVTMRKQVKGLTSLINDHMKTIAKKIGIDQNITTYYARHSFATILKNSGTNVAMISQALGHSSMATTQSYLAGFEDDQLKEATKALMDFKKNE